MHVKQIFSNIMVIAGLTISLNASAQIAKSNREISPYSRFGIGGLSESNNTAMIGIGGQSTAIAEPTTINFNNPATYSHLLTTTVDFAVMASSKSITMDQVRTSTGTFTISSLALAFPITKYGGFSFGFHPVSNVYYNTLDTNEVSGLGAVRRRFFGEGGLQNAYAGFALKYKGFSIGTNLGYMFGNVESQKSIRSIEAIKVRDINYYITNSFGGFNWKVGALYQARFKGDKYLNIGATFKMNQHINVENKVFGTSSLNDTNSLVINVDTISSQQTTEGKLQLPTEMSFGLQYGKMFHWNVGFDVRYADWSKFSLLENRDNIANEAFKVMIGGEYIPAGKEKVKSSYINMLTYRLGAYYGTDYLQFGDRQISFMGGTLGIGFPFVKDRYNNQMGRINTSLDVGVRGTVADNLAKETYVKFNLSVSLNDIWFGLFRSASLLTGFSPL